MSDHLGVKATRKSYYVQICSSDTSRDNPTFRGILYEAINNPREGKHCHATILAAFLLCAINFF